MTIVEKILDGSLIINPSLVEPLAKFKKNYSVKTFSTDKEKKRLAQGLFNFCVDFFSNKEMEEYLTAYEYVKENYTRGQLKRDQDWGAIHSMLIRVERLKDFYDLNLDTGHAIKDRRYHLFTGLRGDACFIINFLMLHAKKRNLKPLKKRGVFRSFSLS